MSIEDISSQSIPLQELKDGIRAIVTEFLSSCKHAEYIPCSANTGIFERKCWIEAYRRGYDMVQLTKYLHVGILISSAAYSYQSHEIKLYITYFTAFMAYVDDKYDLQSDGIIHFMERYQRGERHPTEVLNNIADLLAETSSFFGPVATNMIMCSSFSFMNAMVIEHIATGQKLCLNAKRYPGYLRRFSGISQAYAVFIFRPSVNPIRYIQALPELEDTINYINDILSFYKEELAGEKDNTVSLLAKVNNRTKLDQLRVLTDEVIKYHHSTCTTLKDFLEGYDDYMLFWLGYIQFHIGSKRYRLSELDIH